MPVGPTCGGAWVSPNGRQSDGGQWRVMAAGQGEVVIHPEGTREYLADRQVGYPDFVTGNAVLAEARVV
jgi:hypothetical protein